MDSKENAIQAAQHIGQAVLLLRRIGTARAQIVAEQLRPLVEFAERAAETTSEAVRA